MRINEAQREAGLESGTSTRKKKQRTIFGTGSAGGPPVCKGMKKVTKEKIILTANPYVVLPKGCEFVFYSIVIHFSYVLGI